MARLASPSHGGRLLAAGVVAPLALAAARDGATVGGPFANFDRQLARLRSGRRLRMASTSKYPAGRIFGSAERQRLSHSLVCASDSYRFEVQSDVVATDGHNVHGHLAGDDAQSPGRFDRPRRGRTVQGNRDWRAVLRGHVDLRDRARAGSVDGAARGGCHRPGGRVEPSITRPGARRGVNWRRRRPRRRRAS